MCDRRGSRTCECYAQTLHRRRSRDASVEATVRSCNILVAATSRSSLTPRPGQNTVRPPPDSRAPSLARSETPLEPVDAWVKQTDTEQGERRASARQAQCLKKLETGRTASWRSAG